MGTILTSGQRAFRPYGKALDLLYDKRDEIILSGPAGTGKSRACLEKMHLCALKYPGMRGLIVRKTRSSITESTLVTFEEHVLPLGSPIVNGPQRNQRQAYHYPNGSQIVIGGLDKPTKIMSTEYDMIYVQEAIEVTENAWEALTTRLRNNKMPFQQLIADTNPDSPYHWLKQRHTRGQLVMLESRHEDNPVMWDVLNNRPTAFGEKYLAKLNRLTGVRYQRLRKGAWVAAEGAIYDGWD
jgi:PBSX family phage terminase large subunit